MAKVDLNSKVAVAKLNWESGREKEKGNFTDESHTLVASGSSNQIHGQC